MPLSIQVNQIRSRLNINNKFTWYNGSVDRTFGYGFLDGTLDFAVEIYYFEWWMMKETQKSGTVWLACIAQFMFKCNFSSSICCDKFRIWQLSLPTHFQNSFIYWKIGFNLRLFLCIKKTLCHNQWLTCSAFLSFRTTISIVSILCVLFYIE